MCAYKSLTVRMRLCGLKLAVLLAHFIKYKPAYGTLCLLVPIQMFDDNFSSSLHVLVEKRNRQQQQSATTV